MKSLICKWFVPPIPEKFKYYELACKTYNQKNTPINEVRFVVIDTETTGLNPKTDRILSIAGVEIVGNKIDVNQSFEFYIKQNYTHHQSVAIHEITPGASALANNEERVLEQVLQLINGAVIIGLNVDFDYSILSQAYHRQFGFGLKNKMYDLLKMLPRADSHFAHNEFLKPQDLSLDAICSRFRVPINDRHTAAGDALATALVFLKLMSKLENRGVNRLAHLLNR